MKTIIRKDTCTPVFTATLFTVARTWKQSKCPSTKAWIKKVWYIYIYTMEYHSAIKKNEIMPFVATWMDLEMIILSEVSQTKTNIIRYHSYVESNFKNDINELIYKTETDSKISKTNLWLPKGKCGGEG